MKQPSLKAKRNIALICIVATVLIWGAGFPLNGILLHDCNMTPAMINAVRFISAAVCAGIIFCKNIRLNKQSLLYGLLCGICLFAAFLLQVVGLKRTTPAQSGFFTASYVVFVPLLSWIFYKKRPTVVVALGVALSIAGLALINFGGGETIRDDETIGNAVTIGGAVFFALQIALTDAALKKIDSASLTFTQLSVAAILFTLYFAIFDAPHVDFAQINFEKAALPLAFVSLLGTAFAYPSQTVAQKYLPPAETSLLLAMESVSAAAISVIIGMDKLSFHLIIGGVMVIASLIAVEVLPQLNRKKGGETVATDDINSGQNAENKVDDKDKLNDKDEKYGGSK